MYNKSVICIEKDLQFDSIKCAIDWVYENDNKIYSPQRLKECCELKNILSEIIIGVSKKITVKN